MYLLNVRNTKKRHSIEVDRGTVAKSVPKYIQKYFVCIHNTNDENISQLNKFNKKCLSNLILNKRN